MFLKHTNFSLISLVVDDDNGFPQMYVTFNTSDTATLTLLGPQKNTLFSDSYYYGIHEESMYLSDYRETPSPGTYILKALDSSKNTIYEHTLQFNGSDLTITRVSEDWWADTTSFSLIGLTITVENTGDLPAYPYKVTVRQGAVISEARLTPVVLIPYTTTSLHCFIYMTNFSAGETSLNISMYGKNDDVLAQTSRVVSPSNPVSTWEYHWYYLRGNSLTLPNMEWFYQYYKGLPRFDIADYAAYVFDPFDDSYVSFVASQLLLLPNVPTKDVDRVDFITSFVQGIEYRKDDPLNDSYEYPRYPLETLRDQHGDCEDKAILAASLLSSLGYNVSLIRLPNHMAVGVHLNQTLPAYSYYVDQYYFLETTTLHMPLGKIPLEYQGLTNETVYPISSRPLLIHEWKNATRFTLNNGVDYVQLKIIVENLGSEVAPEVEVRGAFYDMSNRSYEQKTTIVYSLGVGEKRFIELSVNVPSLISTSLKTHMYLNNVMVNQRESTIQFTG
jgi:hypothetical protein